MWIPQEISLAHSTFYMGSYFNVSKMCIWLRVVSVSLTSWTGDQHNHQRQQLEPFHCELEPTSRSFDKSLHIWLDWVIQRCEEGNLHQQYELHSEAHQEAQVVQVTTEVMLM